MNSIDLDPAASLLFARLSLGDIDEIERSRKRKARADAPLSDEELAFQLQAQYLQSHLTFLEDHRLAESLSRAIESDQEFLQTLSIVELGAQDDHAAALALSRGQALPQLSDAQRRLGDISIPPLPYTRPVPVHVLQEAVAVTISSPNRQTTSQPIVPSRVECIICQEMVRRPLTFQAPCSHYYCRDCLRDLTEAATRDESLFPLRCCQQAFPVETLNHHITPSLLSLFRSKYIEFGTPSMDRIYCPNPICSIFLGSTTHYAGQLRCQECQTVACRNCKNRAHPGEACGENSALLELQALARSDNWQTWPGCHAIVELHQGCYHMTCKCRTQFCYLCAAPWKNCTCRQWDEANLVADARRRVDNEFGARAAIAAPVIYAERVQQMAADLRVNHGCDNHRWTYSRGAGVCEECTHYLPVFLMRCMNCQLRACRRCTQNRL